MKVHYPKLYNMAHLLASNVLLLPRDLTIIFINCPGDFNCPDIDWNTLTVTPNALDGAIQQSLIDLFIEHGLTQVHNQLTHQENVLHLVFTNNPSLIKNSQSIPGISDHAMVVTDSNVKPIYNKQEPRKVYLFSKANWEEIKKACVNLSESVITFVQNKQDIGELCRNTRNSGCHG